MCLAYNDSFCPSPGIFTNCIYLFYFLNFICDIDYAIGRDACPCGSLIEWGGLGVENVGGTRVSVFSFPPVFTGRKW